MMRKLSILALLLALSVSGYAGMVSSFYPTVPVLTYPTGTQTGSSTATASVVANNANTGTMYCYASINATESAPTIKANGLSQSASGGLPKTYTFNYTSLSASTAYYSHCIQDDARGNISVVANSASFTTSAGGSTDITVSWTATRTADGTTDKCYVPCAVGFDAIATTATGKTRPFHDLTYAWNFADSGSGTWSNGAGISPSKNVDYGALAAHVFDTSGTYNVCATVYDNTGSARLCKNIVVTDWPNSAETVCVNPFGDSTFTGCPSANHANLASGNEIGTLMGGSYFGGSTIKRILLKGGGAYTSNGSYNIGASAGGSYFGGYPGYGAGNPTITYVSATACNNDSNADTRFANLNIDCNSTGWNAWDGSTTNTLLYNLTITNSGAGLIVPGSPIDGFFVVNITASNFTCVNGGACGEVSFVTGQHYFWLGNSITTNTKTAQGMRMEQASRSVASHSTWSGHTVGYDGVSNDGCCEMFAIRNSATDVDRNYFVVEDNVIPIASGRAIAISSHPGYAPGSQAVGDVLVERNLFPGSDPEGPGVNVWDNGGAYNITVRNNVSYGCGVYQFNTAGAGTGYGVYNNSMYCSSGSGWAPISFGSGASNGKVYRNLGYAPSGTVTMVNSLCSTGCTAGDNTTTGQGNTNPYASSPPSTLANFALTCSGTTYPCGQASAAIPNYLDALGVSITNATGGNDLGAVMH